MLQKNNYLETKNAKKKNYLESTLFYDQYKKRKDEERQHKEAVEEYIRKCMGTNNS